ncbi:MAG TPA: hypothetical protein VNL98_13085 [Gemmatimonadales bacterium]|nr:hypothetical protein [Gemmatimonadales bacterium]
MPAVTVWLVRASLAQFLAGATLGALMLATKGGAGAGLVPVWAFPAHLEAMTYGYLIQMVLGVALWILPRRPGQDREASAWAGWIALGALNGGVVAAATGAALRSEWLVAAGRTAALVATALVAAVLVPRVRAYRLALRTPSSPPAPPT